MKIRLVLEASLLAERSRDKSFVGKGIVEENLTTSGWFVLEEYSV